MSDTPKPSKEAMAFAATWLGVDHENHDWDVGIIGGDYIQIGNEFFNLLDDDPEGPRSESGRRLIEEEVQVAFAELLDLYAAQHDLSLVHTYIQQYGGQINCVSYDPDWHLVFLDVHREQPYMFEEFRGADCVAKAAAWLRSKKGEQ